jgi:hypothetical protein
MKRRFKRRSEGWRRMLPWPVVVRGDKTLRLLSDCRSYAIRDQVEAKLPQWQHAATLMLAAAEGRSLEDVGQQFERILIHQNKLVLRESTGD